MAQNPTTENVLHEPTGKTAGATTKAARLGAVEGGALGTLMAYLLLKTGIEADAAMAVVIGGALATVIAAVLSHFKGKHTPTDQAREKETIVEKPVAPHAPQGPVSPTGVPLPDGGVAAVARDGFPAGDGKHRADTGSTATV